MAVGDLNSRELPSLDWATDPQGALAAIRDHALEHAKEAEGWYTEKRWAKKWGGRSVRIGVVVFAGIAAILPILSQIFTDDGEPEIAPAWASVALVLAASLVALDRYFGFSSGWTRFMATAQEIARMRHDFELKWEAKCADDRPPKVESLIEMAREFVLAVDKTVAAEIGTWSLEFQASLESAERQLAR
jgi:SMODS and SLOG-associating 2TM effector domain 2